jgi:enoyl-CoA hydratase/carnithine racemase
VRTHLLTKGGNDMSEKAVLLEKKGKIATITLNRPQAMNSMNQELVNDLIEALTIAKNDPQFAIAIEDQKKC